MLQHTKTATSRSSTARAGTQQRPVLVQPLPPALRIVPTNDGTLRCSPCLPPQATQQAQPQPQQQQQQGQQQQWDRTNGRSTYRPASFAEMVGDAVQCVLDGIANGLTRMEVEFPPVPTKLDGEHRLQRPLMLAICLQPQPSLPSSLLQGTKELLTCSLTPMCSLPWQQHAR
jgi:hypothetical protein